MRLSLIIFLLLSSFLLLTSSCKINKYKQNNCQEIVLGATSFQPVLKPNAVMKYNTSIDILKNHLTGILIIKQTDSITKHVVFVTELGMKMFDFEVRNNEINALYVFEPLNKPKLINVLKYNLNNMLLLNVAGNKALSCINTNDQFFTISKKKERLFYKGLCDNNGPLEIVLLETFHNHKRTTKAEYIYNKSGQVYQQIKCKQYGLVKFYFELNYITPNQNE